MPNANPTTQPPADDSQSSAAAPQPQPRLRCADRQTLLPAMPLEDVLVPEHPARTVWQFVQGLDLTSLLETIRSVEGRPAIDPQIVVALWLYATIEGIGSAREVAWLCSHHHGFRWLCGGVEVNYHTLADFRVAHLDVLDELLTPSVATLMEQDRVDLNTHHRQDAYTAVWLKTAYACGPVLGPLRSDADRPWRDACRTPRPRCSACGMRWRTIRGKRLGSNTRSTGTGRP
jgi:transposase